MNHPVLIVPGIGNSGPSHWQSRWAAAHPEWRRFTVDDWNNVACADWVAALERQVAATGGDTLIVAHSLGCLTLVHCAARHSLPIRGAMLVAVPDPDAPAFPSTATGFSPLPSTPLPFPTVIVSSSNDPYASTEFSRRHAQAWGGRFVEVGTQGHLNADSDLGDWEEGFQILRSLR